MTTYTPTQAASMLGCSVSTIYRHVQRGHLRTRARARTIALEPAQVAALVADQYDARLHSVDVPTAAHRLGVPEKTVFWLIYSGRLDRRPLAHRRSVRITTTSLERYLARGP